MGMIGFYKIANEEEINKLKSGEISSSEFIYDDMDNVVDIDKAWHAIHFTLTGELGGRDDNDPLSMVVLGGIPINNEDLGCGPLTYYTKEEVSISNEELKKLNEEEFRSRFSLEAMVEEGIYPVVCGQDTEEEFFNYIWENFKVVKCIFNKASEEGKCIVFLLS